TFNYQQYSCVADHYLYVSAIGGGLALAVLARRLALSSEPGSPMRIVVPALMVALLAAYAWRSHDECGHWHDTETYWTRTLKFNEESFPANYNLANYYSRGGHFERTLNLYRRASDAEPTNRLAFGAYVGDLQRHGDLKSVSELYKSRLAMAHAFESEGRL